MKSFIWNRPTLENSDLKKKKNYFFISDFFMDKLIKRLMPKTAYRIYVIELSKRVFTENAKFRDANPQFNGVLECLYVGMTSKSPKERFEQHKTGYVNKKGHKLSSSIVLKYGMYLRPSLYNHIDPLSSREEALKAEEKLALELRRKRYAVWFN